MFPISNSLSNFRSQCNSSSNQFQYQYPPLFNSNANLKHSKDSNSKEESDCSKLNQNALNLKSNSFYTTTVPLLNTCDIIYTLPVDNISVLPLPVPALEKGQQEQQRNHKIEKSQSCSSYYDIEESLRGGGQSEFCLNILNISKKSLSNGNISSTTTMGITTGGGRKNKIRNSQRNSNNQKDKDGIIEKKIQSFAAGIGKNNIANNQILSSMSMLTHEDSSSSNKSKKKKSCKNTSISIDDNELCVLDNRENVNINNVRILFPTVHNSNSHTSTHTCSTYSQPQDSQDAIAIEVVSGDESQVVYSPMSKEESPGFFNTSITNTINTTNSTKTSKIVEEKRNLRYSLFKLFRKNRSSKCCTNNGSSSVSSVISPTFHLSSSCISPSSSTKIATDKSTSTTSSTGTSCSNCTVSKLKKLINNSATGSSSIGRAEAGEDLDNIENENNLAKSVRIIDRALPLLPTSATTTNTNSTTTTTIIMPPASLQTQIQTSVDGLLNKPRTPVPPAGAAEADDEILNNEDDEFLDEDSKVPLEPHDFSASIDKVKDCGWYWGPLSSDEAENLLKTEPDGTFIVRDSSDVHYIFSLTFKLNSVVRHVRIEHDQGNFSFGPKNSKFGSKTIVDFVKKAVAHSRSGRYLFFLHRRPSLGPMRVQLLHPYSRFRRPQSLQHMCRFVILKHVRKDFIECLPLPPLLIDYLNTAHYYYEEQKSDSSPNRQNDI